MQAQSRLGENKTRYEIRIPYRIVILVPTASARLYRIYRIFYSLSSTALTALFFNFITRQVYEPKFNVPVFLPLIFSMNPS